LTMLEKRKILIVENDVFQYLGLSNFLTRKGFTVLQGKDNGPVSSFEDALAILKTEIPDIAILDIELNGDKDGIELAEYLQPFNIPLIFLTVNDNEQNLERAKQLFPKGFITKTEKPYDERQLWNAIVLAMQYVNDRKKHLSRGISLSVKEVKLSERSGIKNSDEDVVHQKFEKFFPWDEIVHFSVGGNVPHNYVGIRLNFPTDREYHYKASLDQFESMAPSYFVRISSSFLINAQKITHHHLPKIVTIGKQHYDLTRTYADTALLKIKAVLGIWNN
jgi:CheY-like chemotaxis protein